jgi:exodeoxyribonuclease VII large subunit
MGGWLQQLDYAHRALLTPRAPLAGQRARVAHLMARAVRVALQRVAAGHLTLAGRREALRRQRPDVAAARRVVSDRLAAIGETTHLVAQRGRARLERLRAELDHLDPHAVLRRGYSIVRDAAGHSIDAASRLYVGQEIGLVLADGTAQARVERVQPAGERSDT